MTKYFICPKCGKRELTIIKMKEPVAMVICGNCNLSKNIPKPKIYEEIDVFGDFIDIYQQKNNLTRKTMTFKELKDKSGYLEF
ncbi:MAG: hypothetical protein ACFE9S_19295 [Candidatus Hermodarchaeota archaeon]